MGNFHCITSGCAEVRYQRYIKGGGIRYRYPGEEWITIDGDDYKIIDKRKGQCPNTRYRLGYTITHRNGSFHKKYVFREGKLIDPVQEYIYHSYIAYGQETKIITGAISLWEYDLPHFKGQSIVRTSFGGESPSDPSKISHSVERLDNLPDDCGECILQIFQDGLIVHEESRPECPEVEILEGECELSDRTEVITIEKLSFLDRVEVVDYAYQNFGGGVYRAKIPDESLNIYRNLTTTVIPQFEGFPTPTNTTQGFYDLIAQISSDHGCPPPKYEVICDCEGSECPGGTCPVECGGTVCCYDTSTGIAVESIPLENYTGGGIS